MSTYGPLGTDLAYLAGLLQSGMLDPQVNWSGSWNRAAEAIDLLMRRKIAGKAVLLLD